MRINSIELTGFRNFKKARAEFGEDVNIIIGKNAQGKTNLLEAVFLLTGGKSFRTRTDRELINFDEEFSSVSAEFFAAKRIQSMNIHLHRGHRKEIIHNGAKRKSGELSGIFTAVLFCPEDLSLIRDGAAVRRRLLDTSIGQLRPGYTAILSEFTRLLEHKTRILKDAGSKPSLMLTLDEFSAGMMQVSARLIRYRAAYAVKLAEEAKNIHWEFSDGKEDLSILYRTIGTVTDPLAPSSVIFEQLQTHQSTHREAELRLKQCLTGAHRDDLEIFINGKAARNFASQGQARTAALSIKLAERELFLSETGEYPVLLLDDVLSELDRARQDFVLNKITGGQTLISCCEDEKKLGNDRANVIGIENGRVTDP